MNLVNCQHATITADIACAIGHKPTGQRYCWACMDRRPFPGHENYKPGVVEGTPFGDHADVVRVDGETGCDCGQDGKR
jgi:hypothetical protein